MQNTDKIIEELKDKDPQAAMEFMSLLKATATTDYRNKINTHALSPRETLYNPEEEFHGQ